MVNLGSELYSSLNLKVNTVRQSVKRELDTLNEIIEKAKTEITPVSEEMSIEIDQKLKYLKNQVQNLDSMVKEIGKMKSGSIALVNQITTISKIRIRDPKSTSGVLSGE